MSAFLTVFVLPVIGVLLGLIGYAVLELIESLFEF